MKTSYGHYIKPFVPHARTFGKAVIGVIGISIGSFMTLVVVWPSSASWTSHKTFNRIQLMFFSSSGNSRCEGENHRTKLISLASAIPLADAYSQFYHPYLFFSFSFFMHLPSTIWSFVSTMFFFCFFFPFHASGEFMVRRGMQKEAYLVTLHRDSYIIQPGSRCSEWPPDR